MPSTVLYEDARHRNLLLEEEPSSTAVQANQHLIVHDGEGLLLDPGGHKAYNKVLAQTLSALSGGSLRHIFLSHQDPDIVAATNGWLMSTSADAWVSALWTRFVPHFGVDKYVVDRLRPIPDEGMTLELGGVELLILPAHFLHSCGNFHLYDPYSRILYSGDLGASLGQDYEEVTDFDAHVRYMEGFHRRYMTSKVAMSAWARMVRQLPIEVIAPQHGAFFRGPEMVGRFIDWVDGFECGVDFAEDLYKLPGS